MKKARKGISFRNKIALSVILIIFLSLIITVSIISIEYSKVIEENNYTKTQQIVEQLANYYNEKLVNIINITHGTIQNDAFQTAIGSALWDDEYNYPKELSVIQRLFQSVMLRDRMIDSIFLYTPENCFYDSVHTPRAIENFKETNIYKIMKQNVSAYWGAATDDEFLKNKEKVLPIALNVPSNNDHAKIFIVVNISEKQFAVELKKVKENNDAGVYIINNKNEIIDYSQTNDYLHIFYDDEFLNQLEKGDSIRYKVDNAQLYVNVAGISINNWRVVTVQDVKSLMDNVDRLRLYTIVVGVMAMVIAGFSAYFLSSSMTKPLYSLHSVIQEIGRGNLGKRYSAKGVSREVDQLGYAFNGMLDEIEELVKKLELEKENTRIESKQKMIATINALLSQINSHFLYNTLDSIYWKSKLINNEVVSEMIISLSNMLRISLSNGSDIIPVEKEIEHVRSFLYLQTNVYTEKFTYSFQISEKLLGYHTLKLILQPMVENSIVHGFDNIGYLGEIKITADLYQGKLHYIVQDNGTGFNADELMAKIQHFDINSSGYALRNIYHRLRITFGEEFIFKIESIPYVSNKIEIMIPMFQGGESDV